MTSAAEHVARYLGSQNPSLILDFVAGAYAAGDGRYTGGVGRFGVAEPWGLFVSKEPAAPDNVITVYDVSGADPFPDGDLEYPALQVRVRSNDYREGYAKARQIRNELIKPTHYELYGVEYVGIWQRGSVEFLMYDDNERAIFVINFNVIRHEGLTNG